MTDRASAEGHRYDHDGMHRHHHEYGPTGRAIWWEYADQFGGDLTEHTHADRASAEGLPQDYADEADPDFIDHMTPEFPCTCTAWGGWHTTRCRDDAIAVALRSSESDGRASAEPRPDSGIDVERLAQALHESDLMRRYSEYADAVPTMTPTPEHTLCIEWAAIIAREYARLSTPRTETSE